MSNTKKYDAANVFVTFNGAKLSGFAPDSFLTLEFDEDAWLKVIGADGEGARARNANRGGSVTLTLMQTSGSNDVLSAFALADRDLGIGIGALMVKDLYGTTLAIARNAWIKKMPKAEMGKGADKTREWVFDTDQLEMFVGGNS